MKLQNTVIALTAGLFVVCAGGCLVMTGESTDESGTKVTQSTLEQIEVGTTTETWVRATLGEPSGERVIDEEKKIKVLRYEYSETRSGGGAVFLIWAGGSQTTSTSTTYFEITDGIVTRHWRES
jgi:hypothetical protein